MADWSLEYALIELVRTRPILYDVGLPGYKNKVVRDILWTEILEKLKSSGFNVNDTNELEEKWKMLRARFFRICRDIPKKCLTNPLGQTFVNIRWPFFSSLIFLKDHIQHRKQMNSKVQLPNKVILPSTPGTSTLDEVPQHSSTAVNDTNTMCDDISISGDSVDAYIHPETPESKSSLQKEECPKRLDEIEKELLTFITNASTAVAKIREAEKPELKDEARTFSDFVASALQNMEADVMYAAMQAISEVIFAAKRQTPQRES